MTRAQNDSCRAIREYCAPVNDDTELPKWLRLPELPTRKELLAPSPVLIEQEPSSESANGLKVRSSEDCTDNGDSKTEVRKDDGFEDEFGDTDSDKPCQFKAFNKIKGRWESREMYLRVHYELLREDALRKQRMAIQKFATMPNMTEDASNGSIGLYDDVHIKGITFSPRGPAIKVTFSYARIGKGIIWQQSKRLLAGSLVVLIPVVDSVPTVKELKVCLVAARPWTELEYNPPQIDLYFAQPEEDFDFDCRKTYIMLEERSGFFEAEKHTLVALQKMMREKETDLTKHLTDVPRIVSPPAYVTANPHYSLDAVFPKQPGYTGPVRTDILQSWPTNPDTEMDQSQQTALRNILTQKLSVVQGPPGTGKTHVSVQALRILLANKSPNDPPIIVSCQTNHALDQLLRHVAAIEPECFVRLGARSKDREIIKPRTLYSLRDAFPVPRSNTVGMARKDITRLSKDFKAHLEYFELGKDLVTMGLFNDYGVLNDAQCASIEATASEWTTAGEDQENPNPLTKYFGDSIGGIQPQVMPIFDTFEEADLEMEELKEVEAENAAPDDDEWDQVRGVYIPLADMYASKSKTPLTKLVVRSKKVHGKSQSFTSAASLLAKVDDLSLVEHKSRGALYDHVMRELKKKMRLKMLPLVRQYYQACRRRQIGRWEEDAFILNQHKLIGLTTTGYSKNRALIASLCPKIVLIEEAAEALEAPIIATCVESLEHLILIGDHQQLRPHLRVRELENPPYSFNISMFERLVDNKINFSQLKMQRRMIPQIRELLYPIYGDLISDHASVKDSKNRPSIPGMGSRPVHFYDHTYIESRDDQMSSKNDMEAAMIVGFLRYLVFNDVPLREITVLTFYNGQRKEIKRQIRGNADLKDSTHEFKIVTVDSYQGEENEVVLLSLVRSNSIGKIGFLENINRVCVSMSRARRGFYMFGNRRLLSSGSDVWNDICQILNQSGRVGPDMPLVCQLHSHETYIAHPTWWEGHAGGCDQPCGDILSCGHGRCTLKCHPFSHELFQCTERCDKLLACGHTCDAECSEMCRCSRCIKASNGSQPISMNSDDLSQWRQYGNGAVEKHDEKMDANATEMQRLELESLVTKNCQHRFANVEQTSKLDEENFIGLFGEEGNAAEEFMNFMNESAVKVKPAGSATRTTWKFCHGLDAGKLVDTGAREMSLLD